MIYTNDPSPGPLKLLLPDPASASQDTTPKDGWDRYLIGAVALCWSLFQLAVASFLVLDSLAVRAIHLAFALLIVFLTLPGRGVGHAALPGSTILPAHAILHAAAAVVASGAALYILLDYQGISSRQGMPLHRDLAVGLVLIIAVLEAGRRTVGIALPIVAGVFLLYALYGHLMPDFLAFKGVSLNRLLGQITMCTEGIYGVPLDVSANIVFLFVLFGAMLEGAGAGVFFIRLALSLMGRFKGGPAKAAIVGSAMTGMISGSSIANVVTTGTFTIPLMKRVGYPATKAAAIEVAAGIDGQIMPPVMGAAAFIMAEYLNVPYLTVARAALIPAVLSYCGLFYITHIEACKLGMKGMTRAEVPRFTETLLGGMHHLIPIGVLLFELIYLGHSPQTSVFRAIVVLILIMIVHSGVLACRKGESIIRGLEHAGAVVATSLVSGARNMVGVAVATSCAGIIVGVVTLGLGGLVTEVIDHVSHGSIYAMLFATAIASIIIGMGIPTTATYIVVASLTAPAIVTLGADLGFVVPLLAAHLFCFYFGVLADDTPPVGLASFAAAAIAGSEPIATGLQGFRYHIRTAILPFVFIFNHELLLIGVSGFLHGVWVFATACVGVLAFVAGTQGWFATANRWYDVPVLLTVTVCMLRPDVIQGWLATSSRVPSFALGLGLFAGLYVLQRWRASTASIS
jgi:TRAP transporter 4TM/12TM fusion protein